MSDLDRLRLEKARLQARCAVLMQGVAWMARNGHQERAQALVAAADKAAEDVRLEDLVTATPTALRRLEPSEVANVEPLTTDEVDAALRKGQVDRDALMAP